MAVYTDVDAEALAGFLADYDIGGPVSLDGILQGIENSNFKLATTSGHFILTLFERRAAEDDLPYFLGLMSHLAGSGFPAPQPAVRRDGGLLGRLKGKPAAIVSFLPGDWPAEPEPAETAIAGAALAGLHAAGADFDGRRANDLGHGAWRGLFESCRRRADEVAPGLAQELAALLDDLDAAWPAGLPAGPCHTDLFPDNLLIADGRATGVIDFYFACDEAYAYDLAVTLNAWCFAADGGWRDDNAAALLDGYERRRPLAATERAALPVLQTGAAMRFCLTRLYDWLHPAAGLARPKDPLEQLAQLRFWRNRWR